MGHLVRMQNRDHFVEALRVLNKLPGMWHARGAPSAPTLLVTDAHYKALVEAGVVSANGKEDKAHGKKAAAKKPSLDDGAAILRERFGGRLVPPLSGLTFPSETLSGSPAGGAVPGFATRS